MTPAKQQRMARELDTRVRYLRLTGLNGMILVAAMSDRIADLKTLVDAAGPNGMNGLVSCLPDLRHYAQLLTSIAVGIQNGTINVPE